MKKLFLLYLIITLLMISCYEKTSINSKYKGNQQITELINETGYKKQIQEIEILKKSMTEYIKFAEPLYTEKDIEKCEMILIGFIQNIDKTTTKEEGLKMVQSTILQLNELNKNCKYDLIETNEREQIAEIIISVGHQKGYNSLNEDITEE